MTGELRPPPPTATQLSTPRLPAADRHAADPPSPAHRHGMWRQGLPSLSVSNRWAMALSS